MAAKEAQSSEISQFVDKMVEKGTKTAQKEQQLRRFEDLAIMSRQKAKMLHSKRQSNWYEKEETKEAKEQYDESQEWGCEILWKHTGEQKKSWPNRPEPQ